MLSFQQEKEEPLWVFPKVDPQCQESIVKEFKIHPAIAQILSVRGITSFDQIHQYLYAKLPDLHDPFLLGEMQQAVDRITKAIVNKENILIYGDNDVDGMTGSALLADFLEEVGARVFYYISSRSASRKSLIVEALEYSLQKECKLLITVDCGITSAPAIAQVTEKNVDVIITDHHEPTDKIPHCIATLNPKLLNSSYPNRELTGVGVAFKLIHALTHHLIQKEIITPEQIDLQSFLDLVALGTISDTALLLGENRILVRYGLQQLHKTKRVGLAKLISVCNMQLSDLTPLTIATKVAPRLNSLGRIDDPKKGVKMLLVKNSTIAEQLAQELDLNNIERQKIERLASSDVTHILESQPELLQNKAIVLSSDQWHPGIIAIITARLAKQYNRPTAVIAVNEGVGKGSLRSIPQFPLLKILKESEDILMNFGGHDFAAGISIKEEFIGEFKKRFLHAANSILHDYDILPKLVLDTEVKFTDFTFDFIESLRLLEPYGNGNPLPLFYAEVTQSGPPKIIGNSHLKLYLAQNDRMIEGIAFGKGYLLPMLKRKNLKLRIAFNLKPSSSFEHAASIQLVIRDIRIID